MSEALLLSVIQKLDINYREDETNVQMEMVLKEMREILEIVRENKLEEGRSLNFLVCDLVDVADDAIDLFLRGYDTYYESIHGWIGEIKKHMLKVGVDGAEMESNMRSLENVDHNYVVGLDEDVEKLIRTRIVGREGYNTRTTLIKGMSGIGKTTLARKIYNHVTVIKHFQRRAWVSNSPYFTLKELLIKLIQQVQDPQNHYTSPLLENMDNRSLRYMLCLHLKRKRYLIVLDDMPKQMHLTFLGALPRESDGSRLLLTSHTRLINIRVGDEDVHQMKLLDSKESWQLFFKTINHGNKLTGEHKFPTSLEHMGKQMLRKCGGLPLAIKEVGKQLAEKKVSGGSEWEHLLESVDFGSTLKLLEPFYHKLDPKLESCFLCMAFFKENTTLRKEKLTHIWDVLGVVDYEDNCESYLDGLINESVIDVKEKSTKYHMNVVLHMLFIKKAEEKLGLEILRNNGNNRPFQGPRHHRVIICSRDKFNYSTNQDKHLVSLFFHGGGYFDTSPSYWKSFELLKILDLEDFGLKLFPETIGTLMELIYLGLRNNYIKELPQLLGCLENLEVLDIVQNFMVDVPDIIWKLRRLRHLYLSDVICQKPFNVDTLQSLETFTYVSVDNCVLSGFEKLISLKKLGLEELDGNSDVSKLFASLAVLENLERLILRGYRFTSMPCLDELCIVQSVRTLKLDGLLARLPRCFPPYIISLTLVNSCLDEDPMPLLGELRELKYLKLRNAFTGQQMVIFPKAFRRLCVLCLEDLWNLSNVQVGEKGMRWLEKLEIHGCPNLDTLPKEIASILYMKEIKMVTTKSIASKIRNSDLISKIVVVNINP